MRRLYSLLVVLLVALAAPGVALAHEAPQNNQSKWVMADWMMDTFFIFSGLAFVAFLAAWKAGHFHEGESHAGIALLIEEEDYYTPEWALEEEESADGHAER
jgi:hypothetical protein